LIDSLRFENTMMFNIIDTLENKLKESDDLLKNFSSDNLKSMLCIHSDVPNKSGLIVIDLSASTSHASDSELDSTIIKPVIVDTACLDNSCLNNHVMPKSKDTGVKGQDKKLILAWKHMSRTWHKHQWLSKGTQTYYHLEVW